MKKFKKKIKESFWFPHVVIEEKKQVWIYVSNHISAMGVSNLMKKFYPNYEACLCSRETLQKLGGKL